MSARSSRKSKPARKRACAISERAAAGVRRSKRGCISQISRMSAASLPRPEMSPMRASKTASTACCSAGNAGSPPAFSAAQRSSTSCHSRQASR